MAKCLWIFDIVISAGHGEREVRDIDTNGRFMFEVRQAKQAKWMDRSIRELWGLESVARMIAR
jgi:Ni,Fe-hydrogenase III component G